MRLSRVQNLGKQLLAFRRASPSVLRTTTPLRSPKTTRSNLHKGYKHSILRTMTTQATATTPAEAVTADAPREIFRKDYTPPSYLIETVNLNFILNEDFTCVEAKMKMIPNYSNGSKAELFLHGRKDVTLASVAINGTKLAESAYTLTPSSLAISPEAIPDGPGSYELEIVTHIKPQENSLLEGLYKSGGNFCSQCEAEGFRGITFFTDRPDVMATYVTRIEADKSLYPVLLSNGNLIEQGDLGNGRHYTVWEDPFKKPCYLFALVAGNLAMQEDHFVTCSGKKVVLRIFVQEKNVDKVEFAMESLKRSMKWDEDVFGLEYDLEIFNIVAVDDFNMGAMENKSLNIFNSRLVLATPDTATDGDFGRIEGVVGHEYFHNYTGNRVTCRDWFQLTLKEGLTVYRDQEFSADMNSRPVKRIEDVCRLRAAQFSEDGGPMSHPVRPDSYIKMDNFYTVTVYEKGAEVVRMYETLLGKDGFRKGMDLYFQRHDGQAVTCDDFLAAMADANKVDLSLLARWYSTSGTPQLTVSTVYDEANKTYTIKTKQSIPDSAGQKNKPALLIPLKVGLLDPSGKLISLHLAGQSSSTGTEAVLQITDYEQEFVFTNVDAKPVPSLLRGFSAPVKMTVQDQTDDDLIFILAHDTDAFNRWEAGQVLAKQLVVKLYQSVASLGDKTKNEVFDAITKSGGISPNLINAYRSLLTDDRVDGMFKAFAISLPADSELVDLIDQVDPTLLSKVREYVITQLAMNLRPELEAAVKAEDALSAAPYEFSAAACAGRALKNKALGYLASTKDETVTQDLLARLRGATNMTDEIGALAALDHAGGAARDAALEEFYKKWQSEPLVILKWLAIQAGSNAEGNLAKVDALVSHPAFNINNPNNCYSLFLAFARSPVNFHSADGKGYQFMADAVLKVDAINHQVAARMVGAFTTWKQYDGKRQTMMKEQLKRILDHKGLSENVFEIASKTLH